MKSTALLFASLVVGVPIALMAQSGPSQPPKKGIFALMDKVKGSGTQSPFKGKLPPRPPVLRTAGITHAQRTFTSIFGRTYVLINFKDESANARAEHEAALSAKNGFKGYTFGMSAEAFVAEATKRGEKFRPSKETMFAGKDFLFTTPAEEQRIADVPVKVVYAFYKGRLARVSVSPSESHHDLTSKELQGLYDTFAGAYGPGEQKVLVSREWASTPFKGCEELVCEDALHKLTSTMLTEQQARGGFRPDQLGENLTYTGYFWHSDAVEINLCTATDLEDVKQLKAGVWAQGAGEHTFSLSISSRTVLGPFLAETKKATSAQGSTGI